MPTRRRSYASEADQTALNQAQPRCSMTDGVDCDQNALAERVNGIRQDEWRLVLPDDGAQARVLVDQSVHRYNGEPPHPSLNYRDPTANCSTKTAARRAATAPPPNP